jgi:hypothetical protein
MPHRERFHVNTLVALQHHVWGMLLSTMWVLSPGPHPGPSGRNERGSSQLFPELFDGSVSRLTFDFHDNLRGHGNLVRRGSSVPAGTIVAMFTRHIFAATAPSSCPPFGRTESTSNCPWTVPHSLPVFPHLPRQLSSGTPVSTPPWPASARRVVVQRDRAGAAVPARETRMRDSEGLGCRTDCATQRDSGPGPTQRGLCFAARRGPPRGEAGEPGCSISDPAPALRVGPALRGVGVTRGGRIPRAHRVAAFCVAPSPPHSLAHHADLNLLTG